jgi:hypothetical protein
MRSTVLNHLETSESFKTLKERERVNMLDRLNALQEKCQDELFKINQDKANNRYIERNDKVSSLLSEI